MACLTGSHNCHYNLTPLFTLPFTQAFTLYEEGVAEQRARVTGLHSIVGSLHSAHVFGADNWATLVQVGVAW
jgi:hypothetical protein